MSGEPFDDKMKLLVEDIILKRELSNLDPAFVLEKLKLELKKNRKAREKLERSEYQKFRRSKEHELLLKAVRQGLRQVYGVFILDDYKKRHELLEELKDTPTIADHERILSLHKSSQERIDIYLVVYKKIFEHTGVPKKILDLGCGLNPVSYPFLGCRPEYTACDLAEKDLQFIAEYFKIMKVKGKTKRIDLVTQQDEAAKLSEGVDITFLFKALDSLEAVKWNASESLMKKLKSRFVVVSFASKSIGGRKEIKKERRAWFEKVLKRNGWEYSEFELPGEFFYVVRKS
jgi:16S rRNA (guanine(1405)-N(7))-methyltransferase